MEEDKQRVEGESRCVEKGRVEARGWGMGR